MDPRKKEEEKEDDLVSVSLSLSSDDDNDNPSAKDSTEESAKKQRDPVELQSLPYPAPQNGVARNRMFPPTTAYQSFDERPGSRSPAAGSKKSNDNDECNPCCWPFSFSMKKR
jgi:hypothetical protein